MASPSPKYEPLPRLWHISGRVGSKLLVQGGRTKDFSEKSKQHLSSVVEIFDPYSEFWEQRQVQGDVPSLGSYSAASASFRDDLFSFGGKDDRQHFNTLHRLDSKTWRWSQVSPQNADGAPIPKYGCGIIEFGNSLVVFGGIGVPRGPTEPGSLFIKSTQAAINGRGRTNEFHIYNLSEGVWSCPTTTGEKPPPCSHFTFTAVDDRRAVMFEGMTEQGRMNDVYIIDLFTMDWSKLNKSGGVLWPEGRSSHAACCLNYGQRFPQLLVTGGVDRHDRPLGDVWILDIEKGRWREESATRGPRAGHSLTAFSPGPELTEVMAFGGTPVPWIGSDKTQPKIADTTLLEFRLVESSGGSQWELLSVVDNKERGYPKRIMEKLRYTVDRQQILVERERDRAREEKREMEGEKDRARKEKREMEWERDRAREKREMEREREREREERVREFEEEKDIAREEKREIETKVRELETQTKVKERAMEERVKQAEEAMKVIQEERDRAVVEIAQHAEALSREAQNKIMELVVERKKAEQKQNEIQLELDVLLYENEGEQERTRKEREKAAIEAQRAEQEITMLRKRTMESTAQEKEYRNKLHAERSNFEHKVSVLEKERDDARIKTREAERAKEIFRQEKIEAKTQVVKLRHEKCRTEEQARVFERERDRIRVESQKEKEKLKLEFQERVNELREENSKTREEKGKAESERGKEWLQRQEIERRLRELQRERDSQKSIVESVQHTEQETGIRGEEQELEAPKMSTETEVLETEIEELKKSLYEQAIESEESIKSLKIMVERMKFENEEMQKKAANAEKAVKEAEGRAKDLEEKMVRERETLRELERERERERAEKEREREEKERVGVELRQAEARANQLQERMDRREHKKLIQEQDRQQGAIQEYESKRTETRVIAERTVEVTNEKQDIVWEGYGLRLHIPPNSLPEDCPRLTLYMTVSKANDYKLPTEDGILVSAVYSFSHSLGDRKLRQPVTLQMQHCVASGSYSPLCIVHSSEMSPPYQFHILERGKFDGSDGYASIKLDHFCSFAVYLRWFLSSLIWTLKPCAVLYYTNISKDKFHFLLYIVPRLDALLEEIKLDVKNNCDSFKWGTLSPFAFDEEESFVCLKLPEDTVSGWKLSHINSDKMETEDIVRMRWEVHPIPFHVEVSWTGGEPIKKLTYKTVIEGAREHTITVTSPSECETIGSATPNSVTPEAFAGLPPPKLADLMNIVGVHVQADWKKVGDGLGLEAATLSTIHSDYSRDGCSSCMREVFIKWNEKMKENSWKKLAQIVSSETVNKAGLLPDMLDKIKKIQ